MKYFCGYLAFNMVRKGFTLIELSLIFFILLLISTVSLTGLNAYRQKTVLRLQQEQITQDLFWAKNNALAQQRDTDIVFFDTGYTIQTGRGALKETTLPKPFTVSSLRLGFNSAGNPRFSGTLYLYRHNKTAAKMTVAVGSGLINWTNL